MLVGSLTRLIIHYSCFSLSPSQKYEGPASMPLGSIGLDSVHGLYSPGQSMRTVLTIQGVRVRRYIMKGLQKEVAYN